MVGIIGTVRNIVGGDMQKVSDKQRILDILKRHEGEWVCSMIFFRELFIKDYAQRIAELRAVQHNIEGEKCKLHNHKPFMYKLNKVFDERLF